MAEEIIKIGQEWFSQKARTRQMRKKFGKTSLGEDGQEGENPKPILLKRVSGFNMARRV